MLRQLSSYAFMLTAIAGLSSCGGQSGDAAKPADNASASSTGAAASAAGCRAGICEKWAEIRGYLSNPCP